MTENQREILKNVRAQVKLVMMLKGRLYEEGKAALRALRMDGMPKGSASTSGLDAQMIRREEMSRMLRREEARLRRMERKARQEMEGMKPELYAFCALYYIAGMSLIDVSEAIDRSERQCLRYKREIEGTSEE